MLSVKQLFAMSLWLHTEMYMEPYTTEFKGMDHPDRLKLQILNTTYVYKLDCVRLPQQWQGLYNRKLSAHILATTNPLVDWSKEPFVPWKGMRFFHGTKYRLLQADQSRVDVVRREQLYGNILGPVDYESYRVNHGSWRRYADMMNLASRMVKSSILPDCALNPDTSFTTPYVEKATNYSKDSSVFTYRLKKDGRELRMLDLRSDYHVRSKRTHHDRFSAISDLTGIKYGNDYTKNRTPLARQLYKLFKDSDVDGAILNNDIEWVWFKPKENLAWEWSPRFNDFTNRLANLGFEGNPPEPTQIETKLSDWRRADVLDVLGSSRASMGTYENDSLMRSAAIGDWSHPRKQLTETDKWSVEVFAPKIKAFLSGECVVNKQVTKLDYFQWVIPSNDPGTEYANQYVGEIEDISGLWAREHIDASILRVVEIDYVEFWQAVCPDALDIYMGNSVTEDYYKGEVEIATAYKILLEVIRSSQPVGEKPIQLLFKLPNGRSQLVPPIDGQTKKLIAEAIAARLAKSKRARDTGDDEEEKRPTSMQRTGTKGRVALVM